MKNAYSNSVSNSLLGRSEVTHPHKIEKASSDHNEQAFTSEMFVTGNSNSDTSTNKHAPGRPTLKSQGLKKRKQITITITEEMHQESMYFAKSENLSLAKYIEKALEEYKQNHHSS